MGDSLNSHPVRHIINPWLVAVSFFTYAIGVGLAYHLGAHLDWINLILGLLVGISMLEMWNFLSAYYDHPESPVTTLHRDDPWYTALREVKRPALLQIALTSLTAGATVSVILIFRHSLTGPCILLFGIGFLISFFAASPPLRLEKNGYGELIEAVLLATLIPAVALVLQGKPLSFFMIMLTLPLTMIYLAMKIALSFESYGKQIFHADHTLVTLLGWQKSMNLHNILILGAFLLIGIFGLLDLPWTFVWPMLLGLPLGVFQIFLIQQIADGARPRWRLLRLIAAGNYLLMTYLVLVTLWI